MKLKKGDIISCKIKGKYIPKAKVQEENGDLFFCQNYEDGRRCKDTLGYKYSYCVDSGTVLNLKWYRVTDIKILSDKIKCPQCNIEINIPKSSLFVSKASVEETLNHWLLNPKMIEAIKKELGIK